MQNSARSRAKNKLVVLTEPAERVLKAVHFFRYMTVQDVTRLLYSPGSLTTVRAMLTDMSGGQDYRTNQYLYRFPFPSPTTGNRERLCTLGSRGRDVLARELGLAAEWYYRPDKVKHMGYSQMVHNLVLTRFLVAASSWGTRSLETRLARMRISYELARSPVSVTLMEEGNKVRVPVIPDAWLECERLRDGEVTGRFPVLLVVRLTSPQGLGP